MIYCVIPPVLEDELYEKMVEYYKDDPNVEVIVDRRGSKVIDKEGAERRRQERRRLRIPGTFPSVGPKD